MIFVLSSPRFLPRSLSTILSSLSSFLPGPHPIWSLLCVVLCSHETERIVECRKEEDERGAKKEDSSKNWRVDACEAGIARSGGRRGSGGRRVHETAEGDQRLIGDSDM
jgi:hypothetical protein